MKKVATKKKTPELWESWLRNLYIPYNAGEVCCYCGRLGDDLVSYIDKKASEDTFKFDLMEVLKENDKTLIPIIPPWEGLRTAEFFLVIETIVACFRCIELHRPRLDIKSIGDKFVEKL